ncbi:MAG: peptidase [Sphingobacteriia bacterium]|nr:MAG: peptidase [Sphingobacteriia bacterium]
MIVSIQHKGLRLLWTKNDASKLPSMQISKIKNILTLLNAAETVIDMNFGGSNLHSLKGEFMGYWSVNVTGNYRIIFKIENSNVHLVDYLDYH